MRRVVLGIGNSLLGDDGIGVALAQELAADPLLPPGTEVIDGGTAGLALLPLIADADALVIVDAVNLDAEPGTLHVLVGDEIGAAYQGHLTAHQVGAADLLCAARLTGVLPAGSTLIGVQPATLATGVGLSPQVGAALPSVVVAVRQWCQLGTLASTVSG